MADPDRPPTGAVHAPTGGRPGGVWPRPRAVVGAAQGVDVGQTGEAQRAFAVGQVVDQFVVKAVGFGAVSDQVFEFDEADRWILSCVSPQAMASRKDRRLKWTSVRFTLWRVHSVPT